MLLVRTATTAALATIVLGTLLPSIGSRSVPASTSGRDVASAPFDFAVFDQGAQERHKRRRLPDEQSRCRHGSEVTSRPAYVLFAAQLLRRPLSGTLHISHFKPHTLRVPAVPFSVLASHPVRSSPVWSGCKAHDLRAQSSRPLYPQRVRVVAVVVVVYA